MRNFGCANIGFKWFAPLLLLGPALSCVAPKSMAALFFASSVFAILADCLKQRAKPSVDWILATCLGSIVIYGTLSQVWTINPAETLTKVGQLALLFGLTSTLVPLIERLDEAELEWFGKMLATGLGLGLLVYGFEQAFNFSLFNLANPQKANAVVDLKQSKAIVLLALWFYLSWPFLASRDERLFRVSLVAAGLALAVLTFASTSISAQIYFATAALWALFAWRVSTSLALPFAIAGIVGLTTLMPALALNLERVFDWRHLTSISRSLQSRFEIWEQASRRIMEKPLAGWGLDASSRLPNRGELSSLYLDAPQPIAHLHPHNAPIQLWFELGAVGIALATMLIILFHHRIRRIAEDHARRFALFLLPVTFSYTLTIWGIWQTWFVATLCFVGIAGYAGVRYLELRGARR